MPVAMEPSPLTQVSRPQIFQPKIIHLYETLFKVCWCRMRLNTTPLTHDSK